MREEIRKAFSPVHASDDTLEEVLKMIDAKKDADVAGRRRVGRIVLVAVILTVMLTLTAFAADYVFNHREVFFFDSVEALMKKQSEEIPEENALYYGIPGTAEENKDVETPVEYVDRVIERGLLADETVIFQGEDPDAGNGWERRRVAQCENKLYGNVVTEYLASSDYADGIYVDGILNWNLNSLTKTMTPDEGGQVLAMSRNAESKELVWVKAHLGYTTEEGKRFSISYAYDITANYGQDPEYILSSAYDVSEIFVTDDGVESLIMAYDGQMWVNAAYEHKYVDIYTTGCTVEEIKMILNDLELSSVLK